MYFSLLFKYKVLIRTVVFHGSIVASRSFTAYLLASYTLRSKFISRHDWYYPVIVTGVPATISFRQAYQLNLVIEFRLPLNYDQETTD